MKRYGVEITPDVEASIQAAFLYIYERSPQNGSAWLRDLYRAIGTLETMPERCARIREQDAFEEDVRELRHHSHRIIFTVHEDRSLVQVHAFRHAAQDDLKPLGE